MIFPRSTCSRIEWYLISICRERLLDIGFVAILIAGWLSSKVMVGFVTGMPMSRATLRAYSASRDIMLSCMYSDSAEDSVTVGWRLQCQNHTAAPLNRQHPPPTDRRSVCVPPQLASENMRSSCSSAGFCGQLYVSANVFVAWR
jgi:hypothetical protein